MPDLAIEYRQISQLPTCIGNERIRISHDGRVWHSRNSMECEAGELWSDAWHSVGQLDAAALTRLRRQILDSGLLELVPQSVAATAEGGTREEMDVAIDDREYHFVVQNTEQPPFREIVSLLWGVMFSFG